MLFTKFNLFTFIFIFSLSNFSFGAKFDSKKCLESSYETEIKQEGKFFGLIKNNLHIKKSLCLIEVKFKNILETIWKIDICREPIHIKVYAKGSTSVYKRDNSCESDKRSHYCEYRDELKDTLQDYGLIFAEGERESLNEPHGQVYCSYLLVKKYLDEGLLFSKYDTPPNIFKDKSAACELPVEVEAQENVSSKPIAVTAEKSDEVIQKETVQQDTSDEGKEMSLKSFSSSTQSTANEGQF